MNQTIPTDLKDIVAGAISEFDSGSQYVAMPLTKRQWEEIATALNHFDKAVELLGVAKCPCCYGDGAYYDNMGAVHQCQWCYEQKALLASIQEQKK